jgi:hypothetical protein
MSYHTVPTKKKYPYLGMGALALTNVQKTSSLTSGGLPMLSIPKPTGIITQQVSVATPVAVGQQVKAALPPAVVIPSQNAISTAPAIATKPVIAAAIQPGPQAILNVPKPIEMANKPVAVKDQTIIQQQTPTNIAKIPAAQAQIQYSQPVQAAIQKASSTPAPTPQPTDPGRDASKYTDVPVIPTDRQMENAAKKDTSYDASTLQPSGSSQLPSGDLVLALDASGKLQAYKKEGGVAPRSQVTTVGGGTVGRPSISMVNAPGRSQGDALDRAFSTPKNNNTALVAGVAALAGLLLMRR